MGLRDAAIAAATAAADQRKDAALSALGSVLAPAEVDGLTVADITAQMVVFTDGTIHLAVGDRNSPPTPPTVCLVEPDGQGSWTRIAKVDDLTALGTLLDPEIPV